MVRRRWLATAAVLTAVLATSLAVVVAELPGGTSVWRHPRAHEWSVQHAQLFQDFRADRSAVFEDDRCLQDADWTSCDSRLLASDNWMQEAATDCDLLATDATAFASSRIPASQPQRWLQNALGDVQLGCGGTSTAWSEIYVDMRSDGDAVRDSGVRLPGRLGLASLRAANASVLRVERFADSRVR
jgi:hypothetical protein